MIVGVTGGRKHQPSPWSLELFVRILHWLEATSVLGGGAEGTDKIAEEAVLCAWPGGNGTAHMRGCCAGHVPVLEFCDG